MTDDWISWDRKASRVYGFRETSCKSTPMTRLVLVSGLYSNALWTDSNVRNVRTCRKCRSLSLYTLAEVPCYPRSSGGCSTSSRECRRTGFMSSTDPIKIPVTSIEHIHVFHRRVPYLVACTPLQSFHLPQKQIHSTYWSNVKPLKPRDKSRLYNWPSHLDPFCG